MITVEADEKQLETVSALLGDAPQKIKQAVKNAINSSVTQAKKEAVSKASEEYTVKKQTINSTIQIQRAKASNPRAVIKSRGTSLGLAKFKTRPKSVPTKRPKSLLLAQVKKAGAGKRIKNAFMVRFKSGHTAVAKRLLGNKSKPIDELFSLSVPQMLGAPSVEKHVAQKAKDLLQGNLEKEINKAVEAMTK